ncbi:MAG: aldo/keto reductase [Candidatus Latescibacteria bacterium]|nr:aldo/keto reductase [Candidatus Latescibacterota bacterium]
MFYRRLGRTDLRVSEISLGTVELGLNYGIPSGDQPNQPSETDAARLLNRALDLGVNLIDTAAGYGTSEEIIGRALRRRRNEYILATKCSHWSDQELSTTETRKRVAASIDQSLHRLQTDVIDLMQIHGRTQPDIELAVIERNEVFDVLQRARQAGKIRFIGYSTYGEEVTLAALEHGGYDTLQVAYNILDQRMASRVFPLAKERDAGILVRSALLKGALTEKAAHLPERLKRLADHSAALDSLVTGSVRSVPQAAIRFVLSSPDIATVLIGTGKIPHLEEAVALSDGLGLPPDALAHARTMGLDDYDLLNPHTWGI